MLENTIFCSLERSVLWDADFHWLILTYSTTCCCRCFITQESAGIWQSNLLPRTRPQTTTKDGIPIFLPFQIMLSLKKKTRRVSYLLFTSSKKHSPVSDLRGYYYGLLLLYRNALVATLPVALSRLPELQIPIMGGSVIWKGFPRGILGWTNGWISWYEMKFNLPWLVWRSPTVPFLSQSHGNTKGGLHLNSLFFVGKIGGQEKTATWYRSVFWLDGIVLLDPTSSRNEGFANIFRLKQLKKSLETCSILNIQGFRLQGDKVWCFVERFWGAMSHHSDSAIPWSLLGVLLASLIVQARTNPWRTVTANMVELLLTAFLMVILGLGGSRELWYLLGKEMEMFGRCVDFMLSEMSYWGRSWVQRLYWSSTWSCLPAFWVGCFAFPFSVWLQQVYLQCSGRENEASKFHGNFLKTDPPKTERLLEKIKAPQIAKHHRTSPKFGPWGPCCCTFKALSNSIFFFVITKLVLDLFVDF